MKTLMFWVIWTFFSGTAAVMTWKYVRRHFKVYLLILISCAYLAGVFVIYGVVKDIPVW